MDNPVKTLRCTIKIALALVVSIQLGCGGPTQGKTQSSGADSFDFGPVIATTGTAIHHEFLFKNNESTPVKILSINKSCGCTNVEIDKMDLAPGETTKVKVIIAMGAARKTDKARVSLTTTSKNVPTREYVVQYDAFPEFELSPNTFIITQADFAGTDFCVKSLDLIAYSKSSTFDFLNSKDTAIKIDSDLGPTGISDAKTTLEAGLNRLTRRFALRISKETFLASQGTQRVIDVKAGLDREFRVPLIFEEVQLVRFIPGALDFGQVVAGHSKRLQFVVDVKESLPSIAFSDSSASISIDAGDSELPRLPGRRQCFATLDLRLEPKPTETRFISGQVIVELGEGRRKKLPWSALIRPE